MTYGLHITNDDGDVVITEGFANHHVVQSGTISMPGGLENWTTYTFAAAYAKPPLIFVRSTLPVALMGFTKDGSGSFNGVKLSASRTDSAFLVDYFLSAPAPSSSGESYGLRVFDAAGAMVYESGRGTMKIKDVQTFATPLGAAAETIIDTAAITGTPYALLNCVQGRGAILISGGSFPIFGIFHIAVRHITDTQWGVKWVPVKLVESGAPYTADSLPATQQFAVGSLSVS